MLVLAQDIGVLALSSKNLTIECVFEAGQALYDVF